MRCVCVLGTDYTSDDERVSNADETFIESHSGSEPFYNLLLKITSCSQKIYSFSPYLSEICPLILHKKKHFCKSSDQSTKL